ncbi:MAG: DNA topoisomerase I [Candidatus Bathyarchaeia archaeon]
MKHVLKSLQHNGIYVPPYDYKGFSVKINGFSLKLTPKSEQMAVAWVRKVQSTVSPPDKVFYRNFMLDFIAELRRENPSLDLLSALEAEFTGTVNGNFVIPNNGQPLVFSGIDFSEIAHFLEQEKQRKLNMTQSEKKLLAEQRKAQREKLKEHYGYALVDGQRLEIANWTAEPSCLFAGRGDHPRRGKWKEGPSEEDIILNLSPDSPTPQGKWKAVVWEPDKMYVAKWQDKLTGKMKYVWFSDSAFIKQDREREKFEKAERLGKKIAVIEKHIMRNLDAEDEMRRKVATVCWLILKPNMRVGDEKDPDEADTVGAITLRPEHVTIEGDMIHFDFLGKDSVRWVKSLQAPPSVIRNIEFYAKNCREYLFEGIDSKKVSRFLSEKMPGLTAKVFRTWRCTKTVREALAQSGVKRDDPDYVKLFGAKLANLKVAEVANHKRKVPANFDERLAKKEARLRELYAQLEAKKAAGKRTESLEARIEKAKLDLELTKLTREYNLGTSLKSYINPMAYVKWARSVDFDLAKFYPKTLRKKFSWALGKIE